LEGNVSNIRDIGGWRTANGGRIVRGLAFRGQALNDDSVNGEAPGRCRLTVEDVRYLTGTLGIKTDLDLRTASEIAGMAESPLGPSVRFVHNSSLAYKEIFTPEGMKAMAESVRLFADPANYPIFFHCIGGADRTGSLAYVLNGVCGVRKEDLERDWESTFYPDIPDVTENSSGVPFPEGTYWRSSRHFDDGFAKYPGATLEDRIAAYLIACGVTQEEIGRVRSILTGLNAK
jgi:protein-tyrosine phosphatase